MVEGLCYAWRMADVAAFPLVKLDDEPLAVHADHHAPLGKLADTSVRDDFRADILAVPLDVVIKVRLAKYAGLAAGNDVLVDFRDALGCKKRHDAIFASCRRDDSERVKQVFCGRWR